MMKKLDKEIKRKGFTYKQYWRDDKFAIYEVYKGKKLRGWEVFKISSHNGYVIAGNKIEASETYPNDHSFGSSSYYCQTLERAKIRLKELKETRELKEIKEERRVKEEIKEEIKEEKRKKI